MNEREAHADGTTVVLHVKVVLVDVQQLQKLVHHLRDVVERVVELLWSWPIAVSKARLVRRDETKLIRQPRKQRLEHTR